MRAKAKKTRFTWAARKVYRRGQGAFLSSGSRAGVGMAGWAMGHWNSFIRGGHSQDNDIAWNQSVKRRDVARVAVSVFGALLKKNILRNL